MTMKTNLILKIKFIIYKNIWIIFLILTSIIIYIISNLFLNFFPIHFIYNVIEFIYKFIESLPITETIQKITYIITLPIFFWYFIIKSIITNIYDLSFCTIHYLYYMIKQYIYMCLPARKSEYAMIWGEEITNIQFSYTFINNFLYVICDGITYILVSIIKTIKMFVFIFLCMKKLIQIILLIFIMILNKILRWWLSYEINPSIFTLIFIIIPFSIYVYHDYWYEWHIDFLHNSEVFVYSMYGFAEEAEEYLMEVYLQKILNPFIYYKIILFFLFILKIIEKWGIGGLIIICYFIPLYIYCIILHFLCYFITFVCYISVYNLAFKHFITIPIYYPILQGVEIWKKEQEEKKKEKKWVT